MEVCMATIRQLKVFVMTAEHKKMSLAAKHLFISQPTISQIISDLEKEYGVSLFERQSRELKITSAGKLLLESAKKIVAINDALTLNMKNFHSIRPLRIGATMTVGSSILPQLINNFQKIHPDIETFVKVTNTAHIDLLLSRNELDIALVEGIINKTDIISKPSFHDHLCFICSPEHPLSNKDVITLQDLQNCKFILRENGSGTRAIFERIMKDNQIDYQVQWETASTPAIIEAVIHNFGLGFVSTRSISKVPSEEIHCFTLHEQDLKRFFYTCTHINHPITSQISDWMKFIESQPEDYN